MKIKFVFSTLVILFIASYTYALTCKASYHTYPFIQAKIELLADDVVCLYQASAIQVSYIISSNSLFRQFHPTVGNWHAGGGHGNPVLVCEALSSKNCRFALGSNHLK